MYYLRKLILHRFYSQIKNKNKKTIVKEVVHFGATEIFSESMNNSKMIFLHRDGRDYVDSLIAAIRKGVFHHVRMSNVDQRITQFVQGHSLTWTVRTHNFLKGFEMHPEKLRYMVKYEDILANTFEELGKLYEFLEIDISNAELENITEKYSFKNIPKNQKGEGKFKRSASPGKWKENFNEEQQNIMHEVMGPTLKKIGYI
jgi:stalled ribosome alternative rescue factor ArfA